jgi:hypothetical protein
MQLAWGESVQVHFATMDIEHPLLPLFGLLNLDLIRDFYAATMGNKKEEQNKEGKAEEESRKHQKGSPKVGRSGSALVEMAERTINRRGVL